MSRPTPVTLRAHHGYRSWTTDWYDEQGRRRSRRFGREGEVGTREAKARYQNWLSEEWEEKEHVRNPNGEAANYTVAILCRQYETFALTHYVKRGKPTTFISQVTVALRKLRESYGELLAAEVTGPMIAKLRDRMIWSEVDEGEQPRALARGTVNDRLQIIKQAFTWAHAEKGRVSVQTAWSISKVSPLKQGRSAATESDPVLPVPDANVARMLRHATKVIADMVRLQRLSGMRPEEACIVRGIDIDTTGDVWLYTPERHKTEHHNKRREIPLGLRAQRIIRRRLKSDVTAYLFSPSDAIAETAAKLRQRIGTRAGTVYTTRSYRQAIHRACDRAKVPAYGPNQLRHAWATEVRKMFGIEATAAGLGHSDIKMAEVYAERDLEKAKQVARKVG